MTGLNTAVEQGDMRQSNCLSPSGVLRKGADSSTLPLARPTTVRGFGFAEREPEGFRGDFDCFGVVLCERSIRQDLIVQLD